jgi:hypothetical protein
MDVCLLGSMTLTMNLMSDRGGAFALIDENVGELGYCMHTE